MKGKRSVARKRTVKTVVKQSVTKRSGGNSRAAGKRSAGKRPVRQKVVQRTITVTRWWLAGGDTCIFCGGKYAPESEYRCAGCDRAVCPDCIAVCASGECTCPQCGTELPAEGA